MPARTVFNLLSEDLAHSRDWYVDLFGYRVAFDSDWFVSLQSAADPAVEIGILAVDHAVVPEAARRCPVGGMLTIVVDDVDAVFDCAVSWGCEILEEPRNLFYGQRRMLLADPDGLTVDVSSPCEPDPEWLAALADGDDWQPTVEPAE